MKATKIAGLMAAGIMTVALVAGPGPRATALAAHHATTIMPPAQVNMVIVPGIRLGPDKKMHDAYTPTDFSAKVGQRIVVTVYNYDTARHSITAPALNLNVIMRGASRDGVPGITTFSFTVRKAGAYHWLCVMPCDDAKGWAMLHDHYMAGTITITR